MSQTRDLVSTIKRQLKAQGKTYAHVAEALDLSEASVKRLFSEQNFTLQRLDKLCQLLDLDFVSLARQMEQQQRQMTQLTEDQEREIAADLTMVLVTVCVINGYTYQELLSQYNLKETDLIQKLAHLDRLGIIDLLPHNRVKLRVSRNFTWRANGPIQQFFLSQVAGDFFRSRFDRQTEQLLVVNALLSTTSNNLFQEKMRRLVQEFNDLAREDETLPMSQKHGTSLVVAMRQWRLSMFDQFSSRYKEE